MDLSFTPEEEAFRAEVRAWLDVNLPEAWRHRGVGGYREEDQDVQRRWQRRLYEGSSWPGPASRAATAPPR
jgi:hypothetical protein